MRIILILLLAVISFNLHADETITEEINQQIWLPFMQSYAEGNGDLHASIYADEMIRVGSRGIHTGQEYISSTRDFVNSFADQGGREIRFRFLERLNTEDSAYETGIFRVLQGNGEYGYGQFQVLIRKIDGQWKLTFDRDERSSEEEWDNAPIRITEEL